MCIATLGLIGAGLGAAGSISSGFAAANAASYNAQVANNNATIARQNAAYSASATAAQTTEAGLKARQADAGVMAAAAANNLDVNTGSPADVETSQREIGNYDTAVTASRGAQQVYGYQSQAAGYQAQAGLDQSEVGSDIAGGFLKAGGSLLSGTPQTNALYAWMQPNGAGGTSLSGDASQTGATDLEFG